MKSNYSISIKSKFTFILFSILPGIALFSSIAIGCRMHHFSSNKLPRIQMILHMAPEKHIFLIASIACSVLIMIISFQIYYYFDSFVYLRQNRFFGGARILLIITGLCICLLQVELSMSHIDKFQLLRSNIIPQFFEKLSISMYFIYFLILTFIIINDFLFYSKFHKNYFRFLFIFDIFLIFLYSILLMYGELTIIDNPPLISTKSFGFNQFICITEYLFFIVLYGRIGFILHQMYGKRQKVRNCQQKF